LLPLSALAAGLDVQEQIAMSRHNIMDLVIIVVKGLFLIFFELFITNPLPPQDFIVWLLQQQKNKL
jgi:hypothetical protein